MRDAYERHVSTRAEQDVVVDLPVSMMRIFPSHLDVICYEMVSICTECSMGSDTLRSPGYGPLPSASYLFS